MKLHRKQPSLIRVGALKGFLSIELYTCPRCLKPVLMVWKEEKLNAVRVAYCSCITYKSHIACIPRNPAEWLTHVLWLETKERRNHVTTIDGEITIES